MKHQPYGVYERFVKRPLDFCCALIALIFFWWVLVIVALLVRVKLGSPVLFSQERPGKDEKIFKLIKFRTMTNAKDAEGNLLPDNDRLIPYGKFLRSTSFDELPELVNIIKGDMSIVGPRPLLVKYLPLYNDNQRHRHDVRPGLTGLAQVTGRNAISWDEKFELDLQYVSDISLAGDIIIIWRTVKTVFSRAGINSNSVTTSEFKGSLEKEILK